MGSERGLIGSILLIILTGMLIGTVFLIVRDTPNSLPGDLVYPFKGITENLRFAKQEFEFNYAGVANVYLDMLQARLSEIEQLLKQQEKDKEIIATAQNLLKLHEKTSNAIDQAKKHREDTQPLLSRFEAILKQEQDSLPELIVDKPQSTAEAVIKVISQSKIDLERLNSMR